MEKLITIPKFEKLAAQKIDMIYRSLQRNYHRITDLSLYSGKMGICLFFFYYEAYIHKKGNAVKLLHEINESISKIDDGFYYILWFSEFGWLLQHLCNNHFINVDNSEILLEADDALQDVMISFLKQDNYELLYGASNIANYFYLRSCEQRTNFFNKFLDTLYEKSIEIDKNKLTWLSYIDISSMRKKNDKHVNLGIAHGISALILLFCKLKKQNYYHKYLDELLIKTCNYILSLEQEPDIYISHFASVSQFINEKISDTSRISWC